MRIGCMRARTSRSAVFNHEELLDLERALTCIKFSRNLNYISNNQHCGWMEKMSLKIPRVNCTDKCLSCPVNVNAFPGKLWKLVNDKNYRSIQWSSCGTTIVIDAHHFKEEVLRNGEYSIFKTQNFSSFVRQLNLYGFRKIATTASAKFIDYKTGMRRDCSHPLHCFAHSFFVQHRPDLLSRVRRTSSANKRRLGFHQAEIAYYGQYGNTFRILGRCGQNVASSFIASGSAQTTPSSYVYPSPMTLGSAAQQQFVHATKPSHMPSYTSDSESDYSDADDLDEESSNSSALLNKSSAKVLWGQGQHAQGDTSNESSPCSQYSSSLISGAEKGSLGAKQTPAEGVHFPLSLHDAHGQLQKFAVAQQKQSPQLGVPPKAFSESPSLDHLHTNQASSPSFWSPVLGSSRYAMPVGVDQEIYGFQQVFDYSSAQIPYMPVYPSAPYMPYGPTTAVPPENMMSVAYYPSSPAVSSSHSNHGSSSHCNCGNKEEDEDEDDRDDFPKENFKKVVVKQELKEVPHSYSALVDEGEESPSPQQAHRRFVWNDCDNERERAEMYAKEARQSLYSTEG